MADDRWKIEKSKLMDILFIFTICPLPSER
jgi:hypothetical protein